MSVPWISWLPLKGNVEEVKFKLYYPDTGLLMSALDEEAQEDLRLNKNLVFIRVRCMRIL